jgi:hypothetical protein
MRMCYNSRLESARISRARPIMHARQAVLLNLLESALPSCLLSYKYSAPITPLKSALTPHSQLAENTATLSPALSALTTISPVTPLDSAFTKNIRGGDTFPPACFTLCVQADPFRACRWSAAALLPPLCLREPFTAHSSLSLAPKPKFPSFIFNHLRTLLQLGGGGGYPLRPIKSSPCFTPGLPFTGPCLTTSDHVHFTAPVRHFPNFAPRYILGPLPGETDA